MHYSEDKAKILLRWRMMVPDAVFFASTFFLIGMVSLIVGALWNIRIWFLGAESVVGTIKKALLTVLNPRSLAAIIKAFLVKVFGQHRLYKYERLRGLEKASFVSFYVLLILSNHIAADIATGVSSIQELMVEFFRSPFFPGYIFYELGTELPLIWALFLLIDNLSMAVVLLFAEGLAIHRRFIKKNFMFGTKEDAIGLFMPVIWFLFRYMAEAATIVKFGFPDSGKFMFIAYGIAQLMAGLSPAQIELLYNVLWSTSGFFLGVFVGAIPHSGRLWHAFAGPIAMLANSVPKTVRSVK
ncbi:MAG: hypothetical protein QXI81_02075 [Nitrososphaerota archaeon]